MDIGRLVGTPVTKVDPTLPGRDLSDVDLLARYCGAKNGNRVPSDYWERPDELADWIRRMAYHYPQDTADADLLARRIVTHFAKTVRRVRRIMMWRPWMWLTIYRSTGRWPWQPEPVEGILSDGRSPGESK